MADSEHNWLGEGSTVGVIGALTVAGWFLVLDLLAGRPFFGASLLASCPGFTKTASVTGISPRAIGLSNTVGTRKFPFRLM